MCMFAICVQPGQVCVALCGDSCHHRKLQIKPCPPCSCSPSMRSARLLHLAAGLPISPPQCSSSIKISTDQSNKCPVKWWNFGSSLSLLI